MISWRDSWRELSRRLNRTLLSLLSVVIAVAAIVAVAAATASTRQAYQQVFRALAGDADLEVVSAGGGEFTEADAAGVEKLPGVRAVLPVVNRITRLYLPDKKKVKVLVEGIVPDQPDSIGSFTLVEGAWPEKPSQVMLDVQLASSLKLKPGDSLKLMAYGKPILRTCHVAGLVKLKDAAHLLQGGMVLAPVEQLKLWLGTKGKVDSLNIFLNEGTHPAAVIAAATKILPENLSIKKPAAQLGLAEESLKLTQVSLNLTTALSFTTAVFIVLNIFLMSVGERRRQISILRAIGATRRQVMTMVASEALLLGFLGTLLGIPAGMYGGRLLAGTMAKILQIELPEAPTLIWPMVVGLVFGPLLCLIGAWYPARKATRVSPLEGLRPQVAMRSRRTVRRTSRAGLILLGISTCFGVWSVLGGAPTWVAITTVISTLIAIVLLLPALLGPAVHGLAWLLHWVGGLPLEIAERLVVRETGRSSLTIGVLYMAVAAGLGTSNGVLSITQDVGDWQDQTLTSDYLLRTMVPNTTLKNSLAIPRELEDEIKAIPGVTDVDTARAVAARGDGKECVVLARDFRLYKKLPLMLVTSEPEQVLARLVEGEVVVGAVLAQQAKLAVGDILKVTVGDDSRSLRIAGIINDYTAGGLMVYLDRTVAEKEFGITGVDAFLISTVHPMPPELPQKLTELADRDGLLLHSFIEIRKRVDDMVSGVVGGLWVLLALGLLVGALGVVNTLTMNVLEQTQELGMLRAIGMQRGQLMRTVLAQAVLIGVLGLAAGAFSGLFLAGTINLSLASLFGHSVRFALRADLVLLLLAGALVIVLAAAMAPAWRATRLSPIEAMRAE